MSFIKYNYKWRNYRWCAIDLEYLQNKFFTHFTGFVMFRYLILLTKHGRTSPYGHIIYTDVERKRLVRIAGVHKLTFMRILQRMRALGILIKVDRYTLRIDPKIMVFMDDLKIQKLREGHDSKRSDEESSIPEEKKDDTDPPFIY